MKIDENLNKEYSIQIKAENKKNKDLLIDVKISGDKKNVRNAVKNITPEIDQIINNTLCYINICNIKLIRPIKLENGQKPHVWLFLHNLCTYAYLVN